jgi:hypothetical protein
MHAKSVCRAAQSANNIGTHYGLWKKHQHQRTAGITGFLLIPCISFQLNHCVSAQQTVRAPHAVWLLAWKESTSPGDRQLRTSNRVIKELDHVRLRWTTYIIQIMHVVDMQRKLAQLIAG